MLAGGQDLFGVEVTPGPCKLNPSRTLPVSGVPCSKPGLSSSHWELRSLFAIEFPTKKDEIHHILNTGKFILWHKTVLMQ